VFSALASPDVTTPWRVHGGFSTVAAPFCLSCAFPSLRSTPLSPLLFLTPPCHPDSHPIVELWPPPSFVFDSLYGALFWAPKIFPLRGLPFCPPVQPSPQTFRVSWTLARFPARPRPWSDLPHVFFFLEGPPGSPAGRLFKLVPLSLLFFPHAPGFFSLFGTFRFWAAPVRRTRTSSLVIFSLAWKFRR